MTPLPPNPWLIERPAEVRMCTARFQLDIRAFWQDMMTMTEWRARQILVEEELRQLRSLAA